MHLSSDHTAGETCQILLHINVESLRRDGFLLELAGFVDGLPGVDILSVEFGTGSEHGAYPTTPFA